MAKSNVMSVHHTDTSRERWDGDAAERELESDASVLRKAFAWVDAENPDNKTAAKFPHHEVSKSGEPGAANVKACISGIGILNGGRGGADIPRSDRKPIYEHLAAHISDAGEEPPELD